MNDNKLKLADANIYQLRLASLADVKNAWQIMLQSVVFKWVTINRHLLWFSL